MKSARRTLLCYEMEKPKSRAPPSQLNKQQQQKAKNTSSLQGFTIFQKQKSPLLRQNILFAFAKCLVGL